MKSPCQMANSGKANRSGVPDPQTREESVRYLTYGLFVYYESMKRKLKIKPIYECRCVFNLVDDIDQRYQTFQADSDKYPTVWVCMCTRKCMTSYDITDKNT
jgi:hypothetical protein